MNPPQQMKAKLADRLAFNEKFIQYSFVLTHPHTLVFDPGQYVSIVVDATGDRRSYSICSKPENKDAFDILVDISPGGVGSQFLQNLQIGQEVDLLGPMGRFIFQAGGTEEELVFVATGSGIAPFRSMIMSLLQEGTERRPMTLYWGMRYVEELFWLDEWQDLAESFANFKFHPVISKAVEEWPLCRGRVTDCLSMHEVPVNAAYYLCGNAKMIEEVNTLLPQKGVVIENIHFEKFF
ncbi:MAG: phenol hydroxylase [Patescibacteria group bacterium]|nr:MAG: phenol hydroxylase [Patescibacteria group bacterium]